MFLGEAVKCHVCNSHKEYDGDACADPMDTDEFLVDCNDWAEQNNAPQFKNATLCRKQTQQGELNNQAKFFP